MAYGFDVQLSGSIDDAVEKVTAALGEQGFGVLTTIDVKATFKAKLDVEHRPYRILGACNPQLAQKAIALDANVGLVMPCNVVVEEADGGVRVAFISPDAMKPMMDGDVLAPILDDAEARLRKVAAALSR